MRTSGVGTGNRAERRRGIRAEAAADPIGEEFWRLVQRAQGELKKAGVGKHVRESAVKDMAVGYIEALRKRAELGLLEGRASAPGDKAKREPQEAVLGRRGQYPWAITDLQRVVYQNEKINYATYYRMVVEDPQVALCMALLKAPIKAARWSFSGARDEVVEWATKAWELIWDNFCDAMLLGLDYGWIGAEILYGHDSEGKVVPIKFADLDPTYAYVRQGPSGEVVGIQQQYGGEKVEIPADKLAVYTYQERHGWVYGLSRERAAYAPWWGKRFATQMMNVFGERFALPWFKIFHGTTPVMTGLDANGKPTYADPGLLAQAIAQGIRGLSAVTLPRTYGPDGKPQYDVETVNTGGATGTNPYRDQLAHYNSEIAKAILMPGLMIEEPDRGTQSLGRVQKEGVSDVIGSITKDLKGVIDPIVARLVLWNFGPNEQPPVWNAEPMGDALKANLWDITKALVTSGRFVFTDKTGKRKTLDLEDVSAKLGLRTTDAPEPVAPPPGTVDPNAPPGEEKDGDEDPDVDPTKPPRPKGKGPMPGKDDMPGKGAMPGKGSAAASFGRDPLGQFRRAPTRHENRGAFEQLKSTFDTGEQTFRRAVGAHVATQLDEIEDQVARAWRHPTREERLRAVENIAVKGRAALQAAIREMLTDLVRSAAKQVEDAYGIEPLSGKTGWLAWASAEAAALADEEIRELRMVALQTAISVERQEGSSKEATYRSRTAASDAAEEWIRTSGALAVAKAVGFGITESIAGDTKTTRAQWSALLDGDECPLCHRRDGQVIDTRDPEFKSWDPPIHFGPCRCVWVPVKGTEEVTWEENIPSTLMRYYQLSARGRRVLNA